METAKIGANERGGIHRLTLSDEDRAVRDWFKSACEALGCTVTVDDCGQHVRAPARQADGSRSDLHGQPSHTQHSAKTGKFDGVLACSPLWSDAHASRRRF